MFREAIAQATKSFTTRSSRSLGLMPQAVANRRHVTRNSGPAIVRNATSVANFDFA